MSGSRHGFTSRLYVCRRSPVVSPGLQSGLVKTLGRLIRPNGVPSHVAAMYNTFFLYVHTPSIYWTSGIKSLKSWIIGIMRAASVEQRVDYDVKQRDRDAGVPQEHSK